MPNTSATGGPLLPSGPDLATDLDFDRVLARLVGGITGLAPGMVRPRWQEDPPDEPPKDEDWCAVGVTEETPFDTPTLIHLSEGEGSSVLRSTASLEVLASFYGPRSRGLARLFADALWIAQNREILLREGANLADVGSLKTAPALVNTEFRRRTDVPFTLTRVIERTYAILNVKQAVGTIVAADTGGDTSSVSTEPFATSEP